MKPTREQIEAEPAGRQLDRWVTLYVTKLTLLNTSLGFLTYRRITGTDEHGWEDWAETVVPKYSTDIAAAWMLVEHLTAKYPHVEVSFDLGEWWCSFGMIQMCSALENAPTPMLAIVRAALLAVLEDA